MAKVIVMFQIILSFLLCLLFIGNVFIMVTVYSQLYVASKILKSSPDNMKFILGYCHVVMSMDMNKPYFS